MCGIVGYIGKNEAKDYLIEGLSRLEYRGYDSSGICTFEKNGLKVLKEEGKLVNLINCISNEKLHADIGIGHTRWATHGIADKTNSHPHLSQDRNFAVVHNGIIENYHELKDMLKQKGFTFASQTDTEVIPMLLQYNYCGNVLETIFKTKEMLKGSFAVVVLSSYDKDNLYAIRKDSPLVIGKGKRENFIASDIQALSSFTKEFYVLEQNELAIVGRKEITLLNSDREKVEKIPIDINYSDLSAEKNGYEYYMLKEIMEQPEAVENTFSGRMVNGEIVFDEIPFNNEYFNNLTKIFIVACGSAYHAALAGKSAIESLARISVQVELASEFRYTNPLINKNDLLIVISQSGETSDTLAALRYGKRKGLKTLSVVNVKESSIARESDCVIYTNAGPEIAVATTKGYMTQVQVLNMLALYIGQINGKITSKERIMYIEELKAFPKKLRQVLELNDKIKSLAYKYHNVERAFFIGRGPDYAAAMEGSLKLKEISYVNSQAYAAGELKHGTISLIEDGVLVVALATQTHLSEKMLINIKEVKARGGRVVGITQQNNDRFNDCVDYSFKIPETLPVFAGSLSVVLLQLFAYHVTVSKGYDVDKPRNLAKSVTVE